MTTVLNLAGSPVGTVDRELVRVLRECGIEPVQHKTPQKDEVSSSVFGRLDLPGGRLFVFERRWCYWNVSLAGGSAPLTLEDAQAIHHHPYSGMTGYYSGAACILGGSVRWRGHAGGLEPAEWPPSNDAHWHVDTDDALKAFADFLRLRFGGQP